MTEGNPILTLLLHQSQFLGPAQDLEENLNPLDFQFGIGPGDKCLMATSNIPVEEDFTLMEIIDHEKYTELYPDWEERFQMNRHVLARFFSLEDPEGAIGWFARVKLIPITEEQFAETEAWRVDGWPNDVPEWVTEGFTRYTDALAERAPTLIPVLVTCGNQDCQGRDVHLHISGRRRFDARAGEIQRDGKTVYVPVNDPGGDTTWAAHLMCTDCGATASLEDEEWDMPQAH